MVTLVGKLEKIETYAVKENHLPPAESRDVCWYVKNTMGVCGARHRSQQAAHDEAKQQARWGYSLGVYREERELISIYEPIKNISGGDRDG